MEIIPEILTVIVSLIAIPVVIGAAWLFLSRLYRFISLTLKLNWDKEYRQSMIETPLSKTEAVLGLLAPLFYSHRLGHDGRNIRSEALRSLSTVVVIGVAIALFFALDVAFFHVFSEL
jgi:hypothetical protein